MKNSVFKNLKILVFMLAFTAGGFFFWGVVFEPPLPKGGNANGF